MNNLRISLVQAGIAWEDKAKNLKCYGKLLQGIAGKSDLAVLPEMFSTGFSMQAGRLAETNVDFTVQTIHRWVKDCDLAVCGSFLAKDNDSGALFNRGFFITPQGENYFYDKRHLFRMGEENERFTAGNRALIVSYKGWNIRLIICYDLRFPVWNRNRNNEYDLLLCPANWPEVRTNVWEILLKARAIENQSYVCGVNRIGEDGNGMLHRGNSALIDFKGKPVFEAPINTEAVITETINKDTLSDFRGKFPVWQDADFFEIK
jgi:predicted amidohydrolase